MEHTADIREWITACESKYTHQIADAVKSLLSVPHLQIVTVTGPTCSGKTTTAHLLTAALEAAGRCVFPVSFDDFFKNRACLPILPSGRVDYDTVAALDLETLARCLDKLIAEESCDLPLFDFQSGCRNGVCCYQPRENDVILLEGIQAMYPEVRAHLPHDVTRSVAILPTQTVSTPDGMLDARELRLLRRLVRDARTRNSDAEKTLSMWEDVCANEDISIYPYLDCADIRIDSSMAYEVGVIRPMAEAVLSGLSRDSVHRAYADSLLARLSHIDILPPDDIPDDSVFREFIGQR
ncbi:MAG: hypothetical protein E7604_03910 [Ruminococcaceae bacterium]|nr:hypothetical protein [Oscillospiraceae bacterium]